MSRFLVENDLITAYPSEKVAPIFFFQNSQAKTEEEYRSSTDSDLFALASKHLELVDNLSQQVSFL
jgi:hypothetical protein